MSEPLKYGVIWKDGYNRDSQFEYWEVAALLTQEEAEKECHRLRESFRHDESTWFEVKPENYELFCPY